MRIAGSNPVSVVVFLLDSDSVAKVYFMNQIAIINYTANKQLNTRGTRCFHRFLRPTVDILDILRTRLAIKVGKRLAMRQIALEDGPDS